MLNINFVLHEAPVGYAVFRVVRQQTTIGLPEVIRAGESLDTFGKLVELVCFAPFRNAADALSNINDISEGLVPAYLKSTLDLNLPQRGASRGSSVVLGVADKNLAGSIKAALPGIECETSETSPVCAYLLRALRLYASALLKGLESGDIDKAALGLGHAYSRSKVKFNVHTHDNHIIKAITTIDNLDRSINLFSQKVREWYGWHFPELYSIVSDNSAYAKLVLCIGDKSVLSQSSDDKLHQIAALLDDDQDRATEIMEKAKISMGREIGAADLHNISTFASRVVELYQCRKTLFAYLIEKMDLVSPNLAALIGETIAARLIQKAGSLTKLAKYPASTLQILGAEKALFRALKTKSNTPKYGIIFHSTHIGRAAPKDKGRISRYLANKCSLAARMDNFSEQPSKKFGLAMRSQVEDRLEFYATGKKPKKNQDVMDAVLADIGEDWDEMALDTTIDDPAKEKKKRKHQSLSSKNTKKHKEKRQKLVV
ncbi:pre-rRNA processing nucleolar protein-like protein Sik1 [Xylaria acuta]|nr:pre-rRNA processing nucleolar protein-like protein Sik1 [Xylaria acuta]